MRHQPMHGRAEVGRDELPTMMTCIQAKLMGDSFDRGLIVRDRADLAGESSANEPKDCQYGSQSRLSQGRTRRTKPLILNGRTVFAVLAIDASGNRPHFEPRDQAILTSNRPCSRDCLHAMRSENDGQPPRDLSSAKLDGMPIASWLRSKRNRSDFVCGGLRGCLQSRVGLTSDEASTSSHGSRGHIFGIFSGCLLTEAGRDAFIMKSNTIFGELSNCR